jgi:hypothetical protein
MGMEIEFEDEGVGYVYVSAMTKDSIHIVSGFFTGWMLKSEVYKSMKVKL